MPPAARLGDMTLHGGTIMVGCPTVVIGGMPAARIGDMHLCPMVAPTPAAIPHVGGPILKGSATVKIGYLPAARMGDMATCTGPPDTIAAGCPTVIIGDGAGGGGGGGAGGGGATGSATTGRTGGREAIEQMETMIDEVGEDATLEWGEALNDLLNDALGEMEGGKESTTKAEHWIEFVFVDTAGLPVSGVPYRFTDTEAKVSDGKLPANGTIARDGIPAGKGKVELRTLYNARWSKTMAKVDEVVQMTADVDSIVPGTKAVFQVYRRDVKGPPVLVETVLSVTQPTTVEAEWKLTLPEDFLSVEVPKEGAEDADVEKLGYSAPDYYFEVIADLCVARSNILFVEDYIEVEAKDEDDQPLREEPYVLFACSGEVREGALDGGGHMLEERIPAGMCNLRLPKIPDSEVDTTDC